MKQSLAVLGAGAVAASLAVAGTAGAQSGTTIVVKGGAVLKPGKAIIDNMRFTPLQKSVKSGSTVTINNKTGQPHTLSLVRKSVLPKTAAAMDKFFESKTTGDFMQAHQVDPENDEAPPGQPLVDVGAEGFDQVGDSVFFDGKTQKIEVTAAGGKNLSYICLVHPWMQGTLKVTK
jgi:plastocyanin